MSSLNEHAGCLDEYVRSGIAEIESIATEDYNHHSPATVIFVSDVRLLLEQAKLKISELKSECSIKKDGSNV